MAINLNNETDEYYREAIDPIARLMGLRAYLTVARWSYVKFSSESLLLFNPQSVGGMSAGQSDCIHREFSREDFKAALKNFSFTKLLVENDRELWFHFTDENAPKDWEEQTYLRSVKFGSRTVRILKVEAERVTDRLVAQIIEKFVGLQRDEKSQAESESVSFSGSFSRGEDAFRELLERRPGADSFRETEQRGQDKELPYDKKKLAELHERREEIKTTLNAAIFSLFQSQACKVRHIYFMPIVIGSEAERVPSGFKRVVGIVSINSQEPVSLEQLALVLQPAVRGLMSDFHFLEIDDQRRMFSLRSAIAAIMSRNMSHNIGSHVLWHLAQELK